MPPIFISLVVLTPGRIEVAIDEEEVVFSLSKDLERGKNAQPVKNSGRLPREGRMLCRDRFLKIDFNCISSERYSH